MTILTEKEKLSADKDPRDTVLFVCSGNTCRSPMCAALFNHRYAGKKRIGISAGLNAGGGSISPNAAFVLKEYGIPSAGENDYRSHVSRSVTEELMRTAYLVVGVSSSHAMQLIMRFPQYAQKITSFGKDIFDPFGGDEETYRFCLKQIGEALGKMFTEDKNGSDDN